MTQRFPKWSEKPLSCLLDPKCEVNNVLPMSHISEHTGSIRHHICKSTFVGLCVLSGEAAV